MLNTSQKMELVKKYKDHFDAYCQFAVADMQIGKIQLRFVPGNETYTQGDLIQIGVDDVEAEDEKEFVMSIDYLLGHEIQHVRSTPDKIWIWAHKRGLEVFLITTAKLVSKKKWLFRTDNDFKLFVKWLSENGYPVKMGLLQKLIHYIRNCLEDGRIERIRSINKRSFAKLVTYFRGKQWKKSKAVAKPVSDMTAYEKLVVVLDQLYYLSVASIYEKGFKDAYKGTEVWTICQTIVPYIKAGVMSYDCKGCMDNALKITEILTPLILEACKLSEIEKEMLEFFKKMISESSERSKYGDYERDHKSGSSANPFGSSDLEIEGEDPDVSDEDSGSTDSSKEGGKKDGRKSKAKADKEAEEKEEDAETTGASGDKEEPKGSDEESPESNEGSSRQGGDENEDADNSSADGNKAGSKEYADENEGAEKSSSDKSEDTSEDAEDSNDSQSQSQSESSQGQSSSETETGEEPISFNEASQGQSTPKSGVAKGELTDDVLSQIEKAMEEAATSQEADFRLAKQSVDEMSSAPVQPTNQFPHQRKQENAGVEISADAKAENVVKLYPNTEFVEMHRKYELNEKLPYDIKGKSDRFSAKIDEVLKNQYKPAIRCRKSGKVDGMMLHKLAMNKTDIFIKPAIVNEFSGCCYMLVDNSGSMGSGRHSKRQYAWLAVSEIEAGYSKLMPLKIVAFDTKGCVVHEIVKDWNEKPNRSCAYNFMLHGRSGCGNMDGFSISVAADEILRQNGRKKLLLVLSDGAPDSYERTKQAIDWARKQGIIVAGIYFSEVSSEPEEYEIERFEAMYGTNGYAICCSPNEISENLYKLMKREFIN